MRIGIVFRIDIKTGNTFIKGRKIYKDESKANIDCVMLNKLSEQNGYRLTYIVVCIDSITISDQLREIIRQNNASNYAIAKEARIDKATLSRFMNGSNLTTKNVDKLGIALGIQLTQHSFSPNL